MNNLLCIYHMMRNFHSKRTSISIFSFHPKKNFCKYQKFFAWQLDRTMNRNMLNLYHKLLKQNISLFFALKNIREISLLPSNLYVFCRSRFLKGTQDYYKCRDFVIMSLLFFKHRKLQIWLGWLKFSVDSLIRQRGAVVYMYLTDCKLDLEERNGGW